MTDRVPLADQVKEAGRELGMRRNVYPKWVEAGRMEQCEADLRLAGMEAIHRTLKWLEGRQDLIRDLAAVDQMPELVGTVPLVLYFASEQDRREFVALCHEAKPGMIARTLPEIA